MSAVAHLILKADAESAAAVAARLLGGELAVIPTETVYGLAATSAGIKALQTARAKLGKPEVGPAAWHAPSVESALDALRPAAAVHRRIIQRLLPGPVTIAFDAGATLAAVLDRIGAPPGFVDDSQRVWVRVPGHSWARSLAEACAGPMVAEGLPLGSGLARTCDEAVGVLARAGLVPSIAVDDGPSQMGRPSTLIDLGAGGSWRVAPGGVYDEVYVRRRIQRTILFVCTGNTCRSPMAEALAIHEVEKTVGGVPTVVRSAGLAGGGALTTSQTLEAIKALGVTITPSRSKNLSRAMIDEADVVYTMTRAHAAGVTDLAPGSAGKVRLLSPRGEDIPDPIGGPQEHYTALARQMQPMIQRRLRELDS